MKPFVLRGHTRPITQVVYNREGDLIFTSGTDRVVNVWFSENGERLGSLGNDYGEGHERVKDQHRSVIWSVDINRDTTQAITGSGDISCKIWDVEYGRVNTTYNDESMGQGVGFGSSVRSVQWSMDGNLFAAIQDRQMTHFAKVFILDKRCDPAQSVVKSWCISSEMLMDTKLRWGFMDETILTANDKGVLQKWDWKNIEYTNAKNNANVQVGRSLCNENAHKKQIKDLVLTHDRTMCMTSSKDKKTKIWDCMSDNEFELICEVEHPSNANSACFNPVKNHIAVGGGEDAKSVAGSAAHGHFETYLYNTVSRETIGTFKGHFSPITSLAWHPNGHQICTAGEEGNARINNLDKTYMDYKDPEMSVMDSTNFIKFEEVY